MYRLLEWFAIKWWKFQEWLDSFEPCPKEQMGYTCRHRTYPNGTKECGKERNYWGESDE